MTSMEETVEILKIDEVGLVRTPREKQEEVLNAFEASAMSGRAFAEHVGVKYPTLMSWVQRRKRERGAEEPGAGPQWLEAVIGEEAKEPEGSALVVELGSSVRMTVRDERGAGLVAMILNQLGVGRC